MAQLNDTMVQGDLRVTGTVFGTTANIPDIYTKDKIAYGDATGQSVSIASRVDGGLPNMNVYEATTLYGVVTPLTKYSKVSSDSYKCEFDSIIGGNDGVTDYPMWHHVTYAGTNNWNSSLTRLLTTTSSISSTDDLEPLLTTARGVEKKDGVANGKILGFYSTTETGSAGVYGIALGNSDGCLRYNTSYIVVHDITVPSYIAAHKDPQNPDITIPEYGGHRFAGTADWAYHASDATSANYASSAGSASTADAVKCVSSSPNKWLSIPYLPNDSPTTGSAYTLDYTSWFKYNPSSDTINIGANTSSGTRTQITNGSLELYNVSGNVTKRMKLEPTVIRMESDANQAIKISVDSTSPSQLNFEYANSSTTILADLNAKSLTATNVTASNDLYVGANSVSSLLAAKMPYIYNMTSTVYDFNGADTAKTALTASGIYAINVNSTSINKPTPGFSGRCTVFVVNSDDYITQTVFESHVYYRHSNRSSGGGIASWSDWVTLLETTTTHKMEVTSAVGTDNDTIYFT